MTDSSERRFTNAATDLTDSNYAALRQYFDFFRTVSDEDFWNKPSQIIEKLCQFTRYFILSGTINPGEFQDEMENFTETIVSSDKYENILEKMYVLADLWHSRSKKDHREAADGLRNMKILAKRGIIKICMMYSFADYNRSSFAMDKSAIASFIIDCIIMSCRNAGDFQLHMEKYLKRIRELVERDTDFYFAEDLDDTYTSDEDDIKAEWEAMRAAKRRREEGEGMIRKNPSEMLMGKKDLLGFLKWISKLG